MNGVGELITQEARYGVCLNHIIFPITFRELRNALAKNGYEISPIRIDLPSPPTRIAFSGEIARKEETSVRLNVENSNIGTVGRSLTEVTESFKELVKLVKTELGVNLHENVRFYQCNIHYNMETKKKPCNEIAKVENKEYFEKFAKVLGENLSSFSVRLVPRNMSPNQEEWLDIAIEPDVVNEKRYHIGVVFRNPDRETTENFVSKLENNLLNLIGIIEE